MSRFLLIFLFIGLFLRLYDLTTIPFGLHGDEVSIGYNAYSLLKTGKDQEGNFLPLTIDQFGDYRPAGYHYLDIPFVATFGLNEIGVRLPSTLFGTASILVFYLFLRELFKQKRVALIGAFLLAINPWHIIISRATSEGVVAAFFILLGSYVFLLSTRKRKHQYLFLLLSILCFITSFFFYHSARFFVPVFLVSLIPLHYFLDKKINKKQVAIHSIYFGFICIFLLLIFWFSKGAHRANSVSILNVPGGDGQVESQIGQDSVQNPLISRFLHNKAYFYSRLFFTSYVEHFSGDYLYVTNGLPVRYRIPWMGNFYIIELPFLLFGFAVLTAEGIKQKKYYYVIPLTWLALAAIPAGLTWEDIPNVQRSSLMIYGLLAITAFGIHEFFLLGNKKMKNIALVIVFVILIQNSSYFLHNYFYHSRTNEPWHRSATERELISTINLHEKNYDQIVMTTERNNNFIFYLFYNRYDPKTFQEKGSPREHDGLRFGKLVYTYKPCAIEGDPSDDARGNRNTLFVNLSGCSLPHNARVITTLRTPDGIPTFEVIDLKAKNAASEKQPEPTPTPSIKR